MSFNNLYYKRTAATAKACYACYKPTTTVLATINAVDFIYTCPIHLSDPEFATLIPDESHISADVSAEEIAKVKAEWEEKQKKKLEKEKEKNDNNSNSQDSISKEKDVEAKLGSKSPQMPVPTTPSPSLPKHDRYSLHRNYFSMRQSEHRRLRQAAQAKELAPRLPGAPKGSI